MHQADGSKQANLPRRRTLLAAALTMALAAPGIARSRPLAQVWKDPNCGCCKDWIAHLQAAGLEVQVSDTGNAAARARLGIPQKYGSCHTALIGGHALAGPGPPPGIPRLLREAPPAPGLPGAGQPVGAPGMDGPAYGGLKDAYEVLLIGLDGTGTVYRSYR